LKRINFPKIFLDNSIDDFKDYINFMEENIDLHKYELENNFEIQTKHITDENEKQEIYEYYLMDKYISLDITYTQILRKSLFFALYSFVETQLRSLAIKLEKKSLTNIKLADISHKGIPQYLFYIETVNNINIPISEDLRKQFMGYNLLRNHFVHNDSFPVNAKQYNGIKILDGVNFDDSPFHERKYYVESIDSNFNKIYLDKIENLFGKLHQVMEKSELD
jgi:hypothetical protein